MVVLIGSDSGKKVSFQVTGEEPLKSMDIGLLKAAADGMGVRVTVSDDTVTLTFSDAVFAKAFRAAWKN